MACVTVPTNLDMTFAQGKRNTDAPQRHRYPETRLPADALHWQCVLLLQQARENLALAQGRYDVTDAQLALTQAESQDIQARVNIKRAEARLRKATGVVE